MRILLIGATGLLGGVLYEHLGRQHEVLGTTTRNVEGFRQLRLEDEEQLRRLAGSAIDLVVHAGGLVDLAGAEHDPALAERVNVTSTEQLVAHTSAKIVYFSSDNVFPGTAPSYVETDDPAPVSVYGRTKLAAEKIVLRRPENLVVRVPLLYGTSPWSTKFIDRFSGRRTTAMTDVITNPVYLPDLADCLPRLWDNTGIVHFGGTDAVTRLDFMTAVQRGLGLDTVVVPVRNSEVDPSGLRPARLVLRSARHGMTSRPVQDAVADMADRIWAGRVRPSGRASAARPPRPAMPGPVRPASGPRVE